MGTVEISTGFGDAGQIAAELLDGLDKNNGIELGILMCEATIDYAEVLSRVSSAVDFPIVGGTTLAFPMTGHSANPVSATLALIRKGKAKFNFCVSDELDDSNAAAQMKELYGKCKSQLGEEPRLIVPYLPLMPGVNTDSFVSALFSLSGGAPVFGGVCTNNLLNTKAAVFANGKAMHNRMVLLVFGGEIKPVFAVGNTITPMAEYGPAVTEVEGNVVKRVDDMSLCQYMQSVGISPQDRINGVDAMMQYGPLPVLVRHPAQPDDDVPEVRCISFTKVDEGSAAFSAKIPEGARVNIGILRTDDVAESAKACLGRLMQSVKDGKAQGYEYSALFCVSCVARYFVFVGGENKEREILADIHPEGLAVSDYYGFCEIGPTRDKNGKIINRSHSASIAMCAF